MKAAEKLQVIRKLLEVEAQWWRWTAGLSELDIDINAGWMDLLPLALDLLGVPQDNTVETRACEIANETGKWPDGAFCRDWCYDLFDEVAAMQGDIDGFLAQINAAVKQWKKEGLVK